MTAYTRERHNYCDTIYLLLHTELVTDDLVSFCTCLLCSASHYSNASLRLSPHVTVMTWHDGCTQWNSVRDFEGCKIEFDDHTWNLRAISLAKLNYRVLKWDISDINCKLESQLQCKNDGDTMTSFLDLMSAYRTSAQFPWPNQTMGSWSGT